MTTDTQSQLFPIDQLKPYAKNSKKHTDKAIDKMVAYITEFGFTRPVLVWGKDNTIVAGHRATLAAKKLGMTEVPIRRVDHLSETQMRALVILDNKSGDDSPFDAELLLEELTDLADLEFKIELTGFDMDFLGTSLLETGGFDKNGQSDDDEPEDDRDESERAAEIIDREIIGDDDRETSADYNEESEAEESADAEDLPIPFKVPERVTAGSAWRLGKHLLVCGNSSDASTVHKFILEESAHSIVSDPPYGISFMGKEWDHGVPSAELWKVWFSRVTPGAHILSFCATRMYHHMAMNIENAGFEPKDMISWMYGSGMPKSMNISKAIDKAAGIEREVVGMMGKAGMATAAENYKSNEKWSGKILGPAISHSAKQWDGWGTALKPANEPIMLARKPHTEPTIAKNVQRYGTGGLNIDGSRIGYQGDYRSPARADGKVNSGGSFGGGLTTEKFDNEKAKSQGRWPSNVILSHADGCVELGVKKVKATGPKTQRETKDTSGGISLGKFVKEKGSHSPGPGDIDGTETVEDWQCVEDCPVRILDEQSINGGMHSAGKKSEGKDIPCQDFGIGGDANRVRKNSVRVGDSGGASRFFYVPKPSRADKNEGNDHATVKPIRLMEYLIKLITPAGGTVLEPFAGSGTTLLAAEKLHMKCIAFELDPHHCDIILARWEQMTNRKAEPYTPTATAI